MKAYKVISILAGLLILLSGCGGEGNISGVDRSTFEGNFGGTWFVVLLPSATGTATINISTTGILTGFLRDNTAGANGTISGIVTNSGAFNGQSIYPGQEASPLTGVLTFNPQGRLVGTITQTIDGSSFGLSFNLARS